MQLAAPFVPSQPCGSGVEGSRAVALTPSYRFGEDVHPSGHSDRAASQLPERKDWDCSWILSLSESVPSLQGKTFPTKDKSNTYHLKDNKIQQILAQLCNPQTKESDLTSAVCQQCPLTLLLVLLTLNVLGGDDGKSLIHNSN